ncbi:MAG: CinA family nicotinamide mononucleotide deamidase-related protein [Bacteroidetes bacterium]|nr:MAG: CinA family nicotinamide mononucleotide deamidase-related protein [Bacteroidota bacterium]
MVLASIITIGDELLTGQTIDTNSAWMAEELNKIGVWVKRRVAVGDVWDDIWNALDEESKIADIILITGGLGPTADDITKPLLCKYFGGNLIVNEQVLRHVKYLFEKVFRRPGPILERNLKQAEVPDVCTVLMNERGTAPGMWFEKEKKVFVSLPGVPHEMKGLMKKEVLTRLQRRFKMPFILHQTLLTYGMGESFLAEKIKDWEEQLPGHIKLAYLPHYGNVRLRLTGISDDKNKLEKELEEQSKKLKPLIRDWLVIDDDMTIQQVVAKILKERKQSVGTAESCTGGYIAHLLTIDPGASSNFKGTVVAYDNKVKEDILNVSAQTINSAGAVSEETVKEMLKGALEKLKSDYAVATSGIMGPDGGTEDKPVGTVWIAVGNNRKIEAQRFNFRFDRVRNIEQTAHTALNMLRKFIENHDSSA